MSGVARQGTARSVQYCPIGPIPAAPPMIVLPHRSSSRSGVSVVGVRGVITCLLCAAWIESARLVTCPSSCSLLSLLVAPLCNDGRQQRVDLCWLDRVDQRHQASRAVGDALARGARRLPL